MIWSLAVMLFAALGGKTPPRTHTVEIRGMEFHPAALTVTVGDTVVWINRDIVPHTATAGSRTEWDTGALTQGQTGRYVATRAGTRPSGPGSKPSAWLARTPFDRLPSRPYCQPWYGQRIVRALRHSPAWSISWARCRHEL